jgi:hypothetical protein
MAGPRPDPTGRTRASAEPRSWAPPADDGARAYRRLAGTEKQALLERCTQELRRRALLIDPERLLELAALRIAAFSGAESEPDDGWLDECIAGAIDQARRIDRERAAEELLADHEDYYFLTEIFFVAPEEAARSAHAFNSLPRSTRLATFELLLHAKSVRTCLQENIAEDQDTLIDRARLGLLTIMRLDEDVLKESKRKRPKRKGKEGSA